MKGIIVPRWLLAHNRRGHYRCRRLALRTSIRPSGVAAIGGTDMLRRNRLSNSPPAVEVAPIPVRKSTRHQLGEAIDAGEIVDSLPARASASANFATGG